MWLAFPGTLLYDRLQGRGQDGLLLGSFDSYAVGYFVVILPSVCALNALFIMYIA